MHVAADILRLLMFSFIFSTHAQVKRYCRRASRVMPRLGEFSGDVRVPSCSEVLPVQCTLMICVLVFSIVIETCTGPRRSDAPATATVVALQQSAPTRYESPKSSATARLRLRS